MDRTLMEGIMKFKRRMRTFDEYLVESLKDPEEAQAYLMVSLEEYLKDHDLDSLLDSLHSIAAAKNGVVLAGGNGLAQGELDELLSENPNPPWDMLLEVLGLRFSRGEGSTLPSF